MGRHVHKFTKKFLGKGKTWPVYQCVKDGCATYYAENLVVGKECVCWRCGEVFTMTPKTLIKKPHCPICINPKMRRALTTPKSKSLDILEIIANIDELLK